MAGCSSSPGHGSSASKPTIKIGATNFEEQEIVANLYGDVLDHAGYKVKVEPALGTRAVVVPAIEHGQIDLEPDYAASLLGYLHGGKPQPAGTQITTAIAADKTALSSSGVTVLPASKALDTNVFAVTKATAAKDHLTTISSLAPYASKMILGRAAGVPDLRRVRARAAQSVYGLNFASFKSLDEAGPLSVAALKNGEVQVVELFSSDGNVVSNNFVALTDDKHLEGADYIVPVIRKSVDTAARGRRARPARTASSRPTPSPAQPRRHRPEGAARHGGQDVAEGQPPHLRRARASPGAESPGALRIARALCISGRAGCASLSAPGHAGSGRGPPCAAAPTWA